jgi:hypothetical protein
MSVISLLNKVCLWILIHFDHYYKNGEYPKISEMVEDLRVAMLLEIHNNTKEIQ